MYIFYSTSISNQVQHHGLDWGPFALTYKEVSATTGVMINWKLSKAGLWTTQTLPHGLHTQTQLKSEFSKWNKTHYSWMLGMSPLLPDYSILAVIPLLTLHAKWILSRMETLKIDHLHGQNKPYFLSLFVLIFVFYPFIFTDSSITLLSPSVSFPTRIRQKVPSQKQYNAINGVPYTVNTENKHSRNINEQRTRRINRKWRKGAK